MIINFGDSFDELGSIYPRDNVPFSIHNPISRKRKISRALRILWLWRQKRVSARMISVSLDVRMRGLCALPTFFISIKQKNVTVEVTALAMLQTRFLSVALWCVLHTCLCAQECPQLAVICLIFFNIFNLFIYSITLFTEFIGLITVRIIASLDFIYSLSLSVNHNDC